MLNFPRAAALVVVAFSLTAFVLAQPSLTPPAGPIEESGRFGTRIELNQTNTPGNAEALFVITAPGSYVLTSDADAGELDGILIGSDDVTVDLNGFTLRGANAPGASTFGTFGIAPARVAGESAEFTNLTVRNGSVSGFTFGVNSFNADVTAQTPVLSYLASVRLERLDITAADTGVVLQRDAGGEGVIGQDGMVGGIIDSCVVHASSQGIDVEDSVITNCRVVIDTEFDLAFRRGIVAEGSTVTGCTVILAEELDGSHRAYRLFSSSVNASTSTGGGIGFSLFGSIANGCLANNPAGNVLLNNGAQVFNSNF